MRRALLIPLVLGACQPEGVIVDLGEVEGEAIHSLEPGDLVRTNGVELEVPEPGFGVGILVESETGAILVELTQEDDGRTIVRTGLPEAAEDLGVSQSDLVIADPCRDGAYRQHGRKWVGRLRWRFNDSTTPDGLDPDRVELLLRRAANTITLARNDCDLPDRVDASHSYLGRSTLLPRILQEPDGVISCRGRDSFNVVGFGPLTTSKAVTCWYWNADDDLIEADIKFNRTTRWTLAEAIPDACVVALDFQSVATHEFGHAFGLLHPEGNHPSQTMQAGGSCDLSKRTLGLGDVRGLESLY